MSIRCRTLLLSLLLLGALARPGAAVQTTPPVFDPANGHWYQLVRTPAAINWPDARQAAQALSFAGYPGHLATISGDDERDFINQNVTGQSGFEAVWLGGYQDSTAPDYREPDAGWRWVTGEPWNYTNWHPGEPNDSPHDSNALELAVIWGGQWDDRLAKEALLPGYVVEFEPPASPGARSAGLVLFPNPVLGGQPALGQVTLAQPAGAGGEVLSLASSNPAAAVVPASVTVPAGASSATFVITTLPVAAPTPVSITAACAFGPTAAILQVVPLAAVPAASAGPPHLTILTSPVESGVTTTGQIRFDRPVPADIGVTLSSSNPGAAEVPATVTVPAGSASATFPIASHILNGNTPVTVTVTARSDGGSAGAPLQLLVVAPQPGLPAGHLATPPVYDPANGHWYQDARGPNLTWESARAAAASLTYQGLSGHLATLTSQEEADFLIRTFIQGRPFGFDWWQGGHQDRSAPDYREPNGGWRWVTGEPFGGYTNWQPGEPNNNGGSEDVLEITYIGGWNDLPNGSTLGGYFVEYEPSAPATATAVTPTEPAALSGHALSSTQIALFWRDTSNNETAFEIWRRDRAHDWARVGVAAPNATTYTDSGLTMGTVYNYRVRAINGTAASDWSNTVTVRTPAGM